MSITLNVNRNSKSNFRVASQVRSKSVKDLQLSTDNLVQLQRLISKHSSCLGVGYSKQLEQVDNPALVEKNLFEYQASFKADYQLHNMFRKLLIPNHERAAERRREALKSFYKGEILCSRTNRRLLSRSPLDTEVNTLVFQIQNLISQILGELDFRAVLEFARFSQGATARLPRSQARSVRKYKFENLDCTRECALNWCHTLIKLDSGATTGISRDSVPDIVDFNRVLTVPKSVTTDRTIAAEPTLNMYFQLGIGGLIRKRLRKFGIDLSDQSRNQKAAFKGSIDGSISTIDLENASNSLAYETVKLLLPRDWFAALDSLRSEYGLIGDHRHRYRMFSSMGNGFTFELETLIFYAITYTVSNRRNRKDVLVYGDDIICHSEDAEKVIGALSYFGFNTNRSKTFTKGHFRESCGRHYYFGEDVTPFFVRRVPKGLDVFLLYNNIVRWTFRDHYKDIRFEECLELVLSFIPEDSRIYGPDGYGDGHLLDDTLDMRKTKFKYLPSHSRLSFQSYITVFSTGIEDHQGALCAALRGECEEQEISLFAIPDTGRLKLKRLVLYEV